MRVQFLVSFDLPPGASVLEAQLYVRDAVACWSGSLGPEHDMADLNRDSVKVRRLYTGAVEDKHGQGGRERHSG